MLATERPEQTYCQHGNFLALFQHDPGHRLCSLHTRTHEDNEPLGIPRTEVVKQLVFPPDDAGEAIHFFLHNTGHGRVKRIYGFPRLEISVWILCRAPHDRIVRIQGPSAVRPDVLVIDHGTDFIIF